MRFALALCLLVGCVDDPGDTGGYVGSGDPGPGTYGYCQQDTDCGGGTVCARDGECLASSQVWTTHTHWTVNGATASDASCTNAPLLAIDFQASYGEQFGYAPVPCNAGIYTIDKIPTWYLVVSLYRDYDGGGGAQASFDSDGNATLDLPY